jgi:hypothetical protein
MSMILVWKQLTGVLPVLKEEYLELVEVSLSVLMVKVDGSDDELPSLATKYSPLTLTNESPQSFEYVLEV